MLRACTLAKYGGLLCPLQLGFARQFPGQRKRQRQQAEDTQWLPFRHGILRQPNRRRFVQYRQPAARNQENPLPHALEHNHDDQRQKDSSHDRIEHIVEIQGAVGFDRLFRCADGRSISSSLRSSECLFKSR